jgi:hypothetical protein
MLNAVIWLFQLSANQKLANFSGERLKRLSIFSGHDTMYRGLEMDFYGTAPDI